MKKETRTIVYDDELRIEAYRFEGIVQPSPIHSMNTMSLVLSRTENGACSCKNQEYVITKGNIILFNPGDNHGCVQNDGGTLDYQGFNISRTVMLDLVEEVTGKRALSGFSKNVIFDEEVTDYLRPLHQMVMGGSGEFGKEEYLLLLLSLLFQRYGQPFESCIPECREEIEKACTFMEQHYARAHLFRPDLPLCRAQ